MRPRCANIRPHGYVGQNVEADSALIAAAPALLEALEAMRRAYGADSARSAGQSVAGSMADAAIEAARRGT